MRISLFYHSLVSDWNHGNAHFLRGIAWELMARGHSVEVYEEEKGWSCQNLITEYGPEPVEQFRKVYPGLKSVFYDPKKLEAASILRHSDLVIVHEWTNPDLIRRIGSFNYRKRSCRVLFHDTHHRSITNPEFFDACGLNRFDGILVFGESLRDIYLKRRWSRRVWVWHEAADTRIFRPLAAAKDADLVWIGNWGDNERTREIEEFFLNPVKDLHLKARAYGVRYPKSALAALTNSAVGYGGWIPNYWVPEVFSRFRATVHIPRRPYRDHLPGVPTIRVFEALACGIPLICAPWEDCSKLFSEGKDYLVARSGAEMTEHLRELMRNPGLARKISEHGLRTIQARHTCRHRADELLDICAELGLTAQAEIRASTHGG